jgi:hypothetical protein
MVHPRRDAVTGSLDVEYVKILWRRVFVGLALIYRGSLVLGNWIVKPLTQLKARPNSDGLSVIFVQVLEGRVGMGLQGAIVLWYGDMDDAMAGLAVEVAAETGQLTTPAVGRGHLHAEGGQHHDGDRLCTLTGLSSRVRGGRRELLQERSQRGREARERVPNSSLPPLSFHRLLPRQPGREIDRMQLGGGASLHRTYLSRGRKCPPLCSRHVLQLPLHLLVSLYLDPGAVQIQPP